MTTQAQTIDQFNRMVQKRLTDVEMNSGLSWKAIFFLRLVHLKWLSRISIKDTRLFMDKHVELCPSAPCIEAQYRSAASIRDKVLRIDQEVAKRPFPWFVKGMTSRMLADWDDLAEDCAIASDHEVRELLNAVASKL